MKSDVLTSALDVLGRWDEAHARYVEHDDELHAVITWVDDSREEAVARAEELEAGNSRGPLHGLLVGIKDNIDTAGVRTTSGASFLADNVPTADAHAVELLRRQGAIVVAKLNMSELAWGATTQNATYGGCRNPWDTDRIPGGSSGGSGAALAARYCDLSLGTDTGASVRGPASLNGVVGLRPTFGAISNRGVMPVSRTQDAVGPMAHSAVLAAHLTEAVVGHDAADPYSLRREGEPATTRLNADVRGLRVGVPETFFFDDLDAGVAARVEEFLDYARTVGIELVPVADFGQADGFEHWTRIVQCEGAAVHEARLRDSPQDFSEDVRGRLGAGLDVPATELVLSVQWRAAYRHHLNAVFDDLDAIVTPVVPVDVPFVGGYDSRAQTQALGRITYPWALHAGPTLSLPIGFHPSGMPVGIALSAGPWREATLFQIAADYQRHTQWHEEVPPLIG